MTATQVRVSDGVFSPIQSLNQLGLEMFRLIF